MNVLVVDDQATNRAILVWLLEDDGHSVIEAEDGLQAVELYQSNEIDIVLTDVIMPVMDGLQAAKKIKSLATEGSHVPIIFLTALDDDKALSECLESGGDDFLSKPYNEAVLKAKIAAHVRIRELNNQISKNNQELKLHNSRWEREQSIVSHIFNKALEHNLIDCSNLRTHIAPASTFNGDILLSAPSPTGGVYVFIGDFTGHGLGASIGTLPIANSFDQLVKRHLSVGEMAYEFNRMLLSMLPDYMFCCASILELNHLGNSIQLWMGGLPDGYILNADGTVKEPLKSMSMPLGIQEGDDFNKGFEVKTLNKGERVIWFTDGVVEAENPDGEFFTEERMLSAFEAGTADPMDALLSKMDDFIQGAEQHDDITLVEVCEGPVTINHGNHVQESGYQGILWQIRCNLGPEDFQKVDPIEELMSVLGAQTLLRPTKDIIGLLMAELYSNALEHGILDLSSELKRSEEGFMTYYQERQTRLSALTEGEIKISCQLVYDETSEKELVLRIRFQDSGKGFDVNKMMGGAHEDSFGRGVSLINKVSKRTQYLNNGNTVEVDFPVNRTFNLDC